MTTFEDRLSFLESVGSTINGDRQDDYGSAKDSFERVAQMWATYLNYPVDSKDVAHMLILMKVSRLVTSPNKRDSYIDIAGYAALGAEL